jgi:hypothetical protein
LVRPITGQLVTSTADAAGCADLVNFSCGDGRIGAERTVDGIVEDYVNGLMADVTVRVTREDPSGALVGLVGLEDGGVGYDHQLFQLDDWKDPVYLAVLTLSAPYRGSWVTKDGVPLSHALMADALSFLAEREGGNVPSVQAVVARDNRPSRALAARFGFEPIPTLGDLLYVRPRGLPILET